MDSNTYTLALTPEIASRFLLSSGVGLPARRETCLLELQRHVIKTFGQCAPKRAEQINKALFRLVWDYETWADATGKPIRRFAGV